MKPFEAYGRGALRPRSRRCGPDAYMRFTADHALDSDLALIERSFCSKPAGDCAGTVSGARLSVNEGGVAFTSGPTHAIAADNTKSEPTEFFATSTRSSHLFLIA